jgi:hypothetical protein
MALALGGCAALPAAPGPSSPSAVGQGSQTALRASQAAAISQAARTHEVPTPARPQTAAGFPTPLIAIEVFATGYINWTSGTISRRMHSLAALSVGQARSAVLLAAGQTARDSELRRSGIANSGTVEAVGPVVGTADQYAVVTRERTTAANTNAYAGLRPAWHLTLATIARVRGGGWTVSSWQPEN